MYPINRLIPLTTLFLATLTYARPNAPTSSSHPASTLTSTSTSSASPSATSAVWHLDQVSEFDNIGSVPGVAAGTVGQNSIYDGLKWNGFSLAVTEAPSANGVPGVLPQSNPNLIAFAQGDVQTIDEGTPMITRNYPDSSISSFNLGNFYYGCSSGTETSITSVPTTCSMTITGFAGGVPNAGGTQVATQTFQFVADGLSQDMNEAIVDKSAFVGLSAVVFTISSANNAITAGLVDNVANTLFSGSPVVVAGG